MKFIKHFVLDFFEEYYGALFIVYWFRWLLSAVVMLPFMIVLEMVQIPLWLNLFIGQSIGSIIFFKIDKYIFRE